MNSKRKTLISFAMLACAAMPAAAQFGGLLGGDKKAGNKSDGKPVDLDTEVKGFTDQSVGIETTISRASLAIVAAYSTEEERAKAQAQFDELGKVTDPKEAGAKFQAISESSNARMSKLADSEDLAAKTKDLSKAKKDLLLKAVSNYLLGALLAKDLSDTGQNVMKLSGANPMNIQKVMPVKESLPRLASAMSIAGKSMPKLVKALQGANVKVPDVTVSSKEHTIDALT